MWNPPQDDGSKGDKQRRCPGGGGSTSVFIEPAINRDVPKALSVNLPHLLPTGQTVTPNGLPETWVMLYQSWPLDNSSLLCTWGFLWWSPDCGDPKLWPRLLWAEIPGHVMLHITHLMPWGMNVNTGVTAASVLKAPKCVTGPFKSQKWCWITVLEGG